MMSPSRRRLLMRIWLLLSVLLFAATCADRVRPYLKTILKSNAKAEAQPPTKAKALPIDASTWLGVASSARARPRSAQPRRLRRARSLR